MRVDRKRKSKKRKNVRSRDAGLLNKLKRMTYAIDRQATITALHNEEVKQENVRRVSHLDYHGDQSGETFAHTIREWRKQNRHIVEHSASLERRFPTLLLQKHSRPLEGLPLPDDAVRLWQRTTTEFLRHPLLYICCAHCSEMVCTNNAADVEYINGEFHYFHRSCFPLWSDARKRQT